MGLAATTVVVTVGCASPACFFAGRWASAPLSSAGRFFPDAELAPSAEEEAAGDADASVGGTCASSDCSSASKRANSSSSDAILMGFFFLEKIMPTLSGTSYLVQSSATALPVPQTPIQMKTEPSVPAAHAAADGAMPPLEGTLEGCVGGFLASRSRFCVRITADGGIRGEVWRKRPPIAASSVVNGANPGDKRRVSEVDEVKAEAGEAAANRERQNWLGDSHILIAHLAGSATYVRTSHVSTRQRARKQADSVKFEPETGEVACTSLACGVLGEQYCCRFEATKRLDHVDRHTVRFHLHIPADIQALADDEVKMEMPLAAFGAWGLPFKRQPRTSSGSDGTPSSSPTKMQPQPTEGLFELACIDPRALSADRDEIAIKASRIYPLRPGKYEFKGFITYDMPAVAPTSNRRGNRRRTPATPTIIKDECIVSLRLLPDGMLRGTSRELVHPQVCPLYGNWQVNRIIYILDYHVRGAVGHFRYSGGVGEGDKLVGKWRNMDDGHADGFEGGKGEFELHLDQVRYDDGPGMKPNKKAKQEPTDISGSDLDNSTDQGHVEIKDQTLTLDDPDDAFSITALTTGHYELKGESTDADGYDYAFDFSMTLLPGGELRALCRERIFE